MSTIKDVAKLSQTSVGTVSRYLNGYPIKEVNKEKIADAIKSLNFHINSVARGLKTSKTDTIGIIIPKLANISSASVIEGMESVFEEFGYSILISDSRNNLEKEKGKIRLFQDKQVDGIILMPVSDSGDHIKQVQDSGLPIVLIDRFISDLPCDSVASDHVNGAYRAVETIINRGHRRIAMIAGPQHSYRVTERLEGYLRALNDYNIKIDKDLICYTTLSSEGGFHAFEKLYESNPPTAVFASHDEITIGAFQFIIERGLVMGEDISLFGYDQTELFQLLKPQLSVVVEPLELIGKRAATILINRIKGDYTDFPLVNRVRTGMIVTNSVKWIK